MTQFFSKNIQTENQESEFQIRLKKEEGVGLLTTKSSLNYSILDSLDYWVDLIEEGYPKMKKCECQSQWFKVRFDYFPRLDSEDIKQVNIFTTCVNCGKEKNEISVNIDYSPTQNLIDQPITFCKPPQIKDPLSNLHCFSKDEDLG